MCSGKKDGAKAIPVRFAASPEFVKLLSDSKRLFPKYFRVTEIKLRDFSAGLLVDDSPDNEVGLNVLRTDGDFVKFAMDAVLHTVTYAKDHGVVRSIGGMPRLPEAASSRLGLCCRQFQLPG